ncbi:betaine/proline/choline family ABC transporter ATP-binding protein [Desulfofundulus sp. TPOSR]|uniref:betaine/proline/choline family ABC transporter ATP-binding protein n=1 Tax=Desulfofundulus sp. TPOSR TaxID=2714340 RepID=UPI001409C692|nr:betaine/proline/choline family ABC transporter ATP-binding protein [Desulfofundulus sp. TPOSR]NHM26490.1 betaine/proline/choline family ABC transporter ATP-binding protein [Desulfofundulus sp. TPOSR]
MIELREVTKIYKGQTVPAVNKLSLKILKGETCVFVGPSGCGKSTTLRMINRLIEPTSGTILIDNKDIRESNPDKLRMGIGYVIQQIGLLPHRTVAENIAIVPRLYGWPREKIKKRVDELLELVGLDPETTRNKFPSQLSGGQMQRVGVARAMAADPPIMLMDEPFGAVDPIVRNYLQDEFLRLQRELKKTICFVTHDINEAIKMGDKIAIFNRGELVQYGTPQEILTRPANDFVRDFIGYDRAVKMLSLFRVEQLVRRRVCTVSENELPGAAQKMKDQGADACFVLDAAGKPAGFVTAQTIANNGSVAPEMLKQLALSNKEAFVQGMTLLRDALSLMLELDTEYLGVLDREVPVGVVTLGDIRQYISRKEGEQ